MKRFTFVLVVLLAGAMFFVGGCSKAPSHVIGNWKVDFATLDNSIVHLADCNAGLRTKSDGFGRFIRGKNFKRMLEKFQDVGIEIEYLEKNKHQVTFTSPTFEKVSFAFFDDISGRYIVQNSEMDFGFSYSPKFHVDFCATFGFPEEFTQKFTGKPEGEGYHVVISDLVLERVSSEDHVPFVQEERSSLKKVKRREEVVLEKELYSENRQKTIRVGGSVTPDIFDATVEFYKRIGNQKAVSEWRRYSTKTEKGRGKGVWATCYVTLDRSSFVEIKAIVRHPDYYDCETDPVRYGWQDHESCRMLSGCATIHQDYSR